MHKKLRNKISETLYAFTLIEIMLVVALFSMVIAFTFPLYRSFQARSDFDLAATTFMQAYRRAQILSMIAENDNQWGVKFISGSVIVFKGVSYASRDLQYDEASQISPVISISGTDEIIFEKISGKSSYKGNISLNGLNAQVRQFSINDIGVID